MSNTTNEIAQFNYGTASIPNLFITVVIPSIISMIIFGAQGIIDGLFLGNYVGTSAMASANIASPFLHIIFGISFVIGTGSTAYIGRCLGSNEINKAQNIFKTCYNTLLVASIVVLSTGYFFSSTISILFGASDTLLADSSQYIKILSIFSPLIMLYLFFSFTNRAIGRPHLLMYGSIACVLGNVIFNYIFIVLLNLDMTGAALATSLSFTLGFIINIFPMISKKTIVNIYSGKYNTNLLYTVACNGASEGINATAIAVTTLLFNLTFMHYYGDSGVASFTIVNYIGQFVCNLLFGIADGITPIISYNIGANLNHRVRKIMKVSILSNFIIGVLTMLFVWTNCELIIGLFSNSDKTLISMTSYGAKIYAISFLFAGFNIIFSAYYTAKGDAFSSAIIAASRGLIFIVIGIITLPHLWGIRGVWLVIPLADIFTIFICFHLYKTKA